MKTIFVPTDFSKCAMNAMKLAFFLAKHFKSEIVAFHNILPTQGVDNNIYDAYFIEEYVKIKEAKLARNISRLLKQPDYEGISVKTICELGFAADNISDLAAKHNADLIVMGTTGASGLKELTLGSVAGSIIRKTEIPTMIVPEVFDSSTLYDVFVLASDMSAKLNEKSKAAILALSKMKNATLKVVNVLESENEKPDTDAEQKVSNMLTAEIKHDFHYLHGGKPTEAIQHFLEASDASLLCMISHHHGFVYRLFYDSTTRQMAYHTRIPLLVLHD